MAAVDERPYPHNIEAERALLGGVLQAPELLVDVADRIIPADFYREDHRRLWLLMLEMHADCEPIDLVTVPSRVMAHRDEQRFGGAEYVLGLPGACPSTANLVHYASEIRRLSQHRQAACALETAIDKAIDAEGEAEDVLETCKARLDEAVRDDGAVSDGAALADEVLAQAVCGEGGCQGYGAGLAALENAIGMLYRTDLVVVAARPGMGKTALAAGIAEHVQYETGHVAVFSMEMPARQWMARVICQRAGVSFAAWRKGVLSDGAVEDMRAAREDMGQVRMHIDDRSGLTIEQIAARCSRLESRHGKLALVVIDYLQLMRGRGLRVDVIEHNSAGAKQLAKDRDCPVLLLSQLNRRVEDRQDRRPNLADLRGTGAIEQDADIVLFVYRDEVYNPRSEDRGRAELIGAKRRNGPTSTGSCAFDGPCMRFRDLE